MKAKLIIDKELFCKIIGKIKEQITRDEECSKAFGIILKNDFITGYDNYLIVDAILDILKLAFKDNHKYSTIDYFVYELNFGKEYKEGCISDSYGNIDISTPENLYDYLIHKMEENDER